MLHKLGYDFLCERCGKPCSFDECTALDAEREICDECLSAEGAAEQERTLRSIICASMDLSANDITKIVEDELRRTR